MKKSFFLIISISFFLLNASPQSFQEGFEFNLPWDDTTLVEFLPEFDQTTITNEDFVSTDEYGNFILNDESYRFFGVNLTTKGAFPEKEHAPIIAARMKKFGINLVRFHHIDNPWSNGSLFYGENGTRSFNSAILDRLDYLIYQLKLHGIYVNMNLNVSRTFENEDGVVDADSLSDFGKGVTQFDPWMIALQKEYAEMLLNHTNPYTGIPLSRDPVLAMVEIINENSLYRMWYSGALKPISEGGKLPVYYNNQLDSLWNDFLIEKYDSTAVLDSVWSEDLLKGDTIFFDGFEKGIGEQWLVELHNTALAETYTSNSAATGDSSACVEVTATSDVDWHTKFKFVGSSIKKDSIYEVILKARSEVPQGIKISFQRDNSPWTFYGSHDLMLDTLFNEYKVSFKAPEDNNANLRVGISFHNKTGKFWFDDFVFKKQSKIGLESDESLTRRNITRIGSNQIHSFTQARVRDMTAFYAKVQKDFLDEMHSWLEDNLGVIAPITGTNWFTGSEDVYVQSGLDYIDNHSYWDHPQFPNTPWSPIDWKINNTPMLTANSSTIENLFNGMIVKNKPYTVSEYNHAFPNQYQPELLPVITSYLSFNDADGFMLFQYSSEWDYQTNRINRYFDINRNTCIMGSFPLFAYVFRNNLIKSADNILEINYSREDILQMPFNLENWWSAHYPYNEKLAYTNRIELSFDNQQDLDISELPAPSTEPYDFNDRILYWDKQGLFKINTEKFSSITGHLDRFSGATAGSLKLVSSSDFGAVHWLSLTDSSLESASVSLLNVATKVQNTGMIWDGTVTVHNSWGVAPVLVYPLQLELEFKTGFEALILTRLDEYGVPDLKSSDTIPADSSGWVNYTLDQRVKRSTWYGIESFTFPEDTANTGLQDNNHNILSCFPNPTRHNITFHLTEVFEKGTTVLLFNQHGVNVLKRDMIGGRKTISFDISTLTPGTYYYQIYGNRNNHTGRFIVLK